MGLWVLSSFFKSTNTGRVAFCSLALLVFALSLAFAEKPFDWAQLDGRWVYQKWSQAEEHRCCDLSDTATFSDVDPQIRNGTPMQDIVWDPNKTYCAHAYIPARVNLQRFHRDGAVNLPIENGQVPIAAGDACSCQIYENKQIPESDTITDVGEWVWLPDKNKRNTVPNFLKWNATKFCKLLGERRIIVVGDSNLFQSFNTLVGRLAAEHAGCQKQIYCASSDLLAPANILVEGNCSRQKQPVERGKNLSAVLETYGLLHTNAEPTIVVMGVGNHIATSLCHHLVHQWLRKFFIEWGPTFRNRGVRLMWKTNYKPHNGCESATKPALHNRVSYHRVYANWAKAERYDEEAVKAISSLRKQIRPTILDMSPLYLRPDAHSVGCSSHYCVHRITGDALSYFVYALYDALENPQKKHV
mmetsp:Transcript_48299/g.98635  ORF Transcript_48299/g.98635 Transcript_48299/m.98635 type:complete len:415 (+) Transcript_48299:78-1322(+)|eukprot:CAMPEP_0181312830 /NCGR_PEP_ID=MMETSP1101-20121128/13913_1 /TAXON_ID=46948 /ORGANISM="Rhodomonas abbreviata, Strain Caron Lab Isolate" /LENGTH=414 /DNA_ID=CAMNT_0023419721 /DNA_START=71 /DNA_END=1315 /DNA_ORIENTATION=+